MNFVGTAKVDLGCDPELFCASDIRWRHPVLAPGAKVFSPADGAAVRRFVSANVPEIKASLKGQMPVGVVVDHGDPLLIVEHDTTDLDALAPWSFWVKIGCRECGVEAEGARRVFAAIAMFARRLG